MTQIVLNVGAGHRQSGANLPPVFRTSAWQEVRLDIDPVNEPDVIGTMLDMSAVETESIDAIYSSHTIEWSKGSGSFKETLIYSVLWSDDDGKMRKC